MVTRNHYGDKVRVLQPYMKLQDFPAYFLNVSLTINFKSIISFQVFGRHFT